MRSVLAQGGICGRLAYLAGVGAAAVALVGCAKSDPGPIAGTWRVEGAVAMTISYRPGETEALGLIEKVSYEVAGQGNEVIVKTESGPMAGVAMRIRVLGPDTLQSQLGVMRRVR